MTDRFSCSRDAHARDEPMSATASKVQRWVLVEQPGPWGRDAVTESRLPGDVGRALLERGRDLDARVLLIRRYGRYDPDERGSTAYVAYSSRDRSWVERFAFDDPVQLVELPLAPLRNGERVGGEPVDGPLYLVCTNGRHDVCCAEFGRPLAAVLDAARPGRSWEVSHIGGDRFAGNLVCLPHGLYFGRVGPGDARGVVERYERGEIDLAHFRGRSCYSFLVQAAEQFLRDAEDLRGIHDVVALRRERLDADRWRVRFAGPAGRRVDVDVEVGADPEPRRLTCSSDVLSHPPRYACLAISAAH